MSPELVSSLIGALLIAWGAFTALRSVRATTRLSVLAELLTAVMLFLLIRLIVPFGGWDGWFIYVWIAGLLALVIAVFRAGLVWSGLPWRAKDAKARRKEMRGLVFVSLLALVAVSALVLPGLLL